MNRIVAAAALAVALGAGSTQATPAQDELAAGLIAEFYDLGTATEDFPVLAADRKPAVRRIDKHVNYESTTERFAGTELSDYFYVRWTGLVRVPKDGKYTFFTESDDGSRLWIDDKQIVDNGGLHAMEEKSGEMTLKAGDYAIRIDVFDNAGPAGCKVSWEADGMAKEIIPEKAFFHKKDKELDK